MVQVRTRIILFGRIAFFTSAVSHAQNQSPPQPPDLPPSNPTSSPQVVLFPEPPSMPLPSDAPIPELAEIPGPPDKSRFLIRRALDRAKPNCIDGVVHTCWSSPPGDAMTGMSKASREYVEDMEMELTTSRKGIVAAPCFVSATLSTTSRGTLGRPSKWQSLWTNSTSARTQSKHIRPT